MKELRLKIERVKNVKKKEKKELGYGLLYYERWESEKENCDNHDRMEDRCRNDVY